MENYRLPIESCCSSANDRITELTRALKQKACEKIDTLMEEKIKEITPAYMASSKYSEVKKLMDELSKLEAQKRDLYYQLSKFIGSDFFVPADCNTEKTAIYNLAGFTSLMHGLYREAENEVVIELNTPGSTPQTILDNIENITREKLARVPVNL